MIGAGTGVVTPAVVSPAPDPPEGGTALSASESLPLAPSLLLLLALSDSEVVLAPEFDTSSATFSSTNCRFVAFRLALLQEIEKMTRVNKKICLRKTSMRLS
jgi:hypothetical protein